MVWQIPAAIWGGCWAPQHWYKGAPNEHSLDVSTEDLGKEDHSSKKGKKPFWSEERNRSPCVWGGITMGPQHASDPQIFTDHAQHGPGTGPS